MVNNMNKTENMNKATMSIKKNGHKVVNWIDTHDGIIMGSLAMIAMLMLAVAYGHDVMVWFTDEFSYVVNSELTVSEFITRELGLFCISMIQTVDNMLINLMRLIELFM